MECPVCLEEYSAEARQPKMLPCGHTICLPCLQQLPTCPNNCSQLFEGDVQALPTNFALLQTGGQVAEEWWCSECGAPAEEGCRREHLVMQARPALRRQALQLAPAAAEAAQGLGEAVRAAAGKPARFALQLLAEHQADAAADCRLSLRRGGGAFNAQYTLADDGAVGALARALVCALAAEGRLLRDEPQHQGQPVVQQRPAQQQPPPEQAPQQQQPLQQFLLQPHEEWLVPPLPAVGLPFAAAFIQNLNVREVSESGPQERLAEKAQLLHRVRWNGVSKLTGLDCSADWKWSRALLRAAVAAGPLASLTLSNVRETHLCVANEAPRLLSLHILSSDASLHVSPPVLLALPRRSTLKALNATALPARTLDVLLRVHGDSLTHLKYVAPVERRATDSTLSNHLSECGLVLLRTLFLSRAGERHTAAGCRRQVEALRRALPSLQTVLCDVCDDDAGYRFEADARSVFNAAAPPNRD